MRRCLRPAQASGVVSGSALELVAPEAGVERLWVGEERLPLLPCRLIGRRHPDPGRQGSSTKRRVRSGRDVGQGAKSGADRGLTAGIVAVEAHDRRGIEAPHALELRFGDGGAVGCDGLGDSGAVEAQSRPYSPRRRSGAGRCGSPGSARSML